ncbi:hypothetical protein B296_00032081 [Ensete ventricosum]|uniref:Uncharacterized protein n=1 Tax=Ensete ventricosum TaxID=4639 RepID=A0A426ZK54_ENSVE|nr:hypothetical protein B296_00032081 [Ensete ventricosum]
MLPRPRPLRSTHSNSKNHKLPLSKNVLLFQTPGRLAPTGPHSFSSRQDRSAKQPLTSPNAEAATSASDENLLFRTLITSSPSRSLLGVQDERMRRGTIRKRRWRELVDRNPRRERSSNGRSYRERSVSLRSLSLSLLLRLIMPTSPLASVTADTNLSNHISTRDESLEFADMASSYRRLLLFRHQIVARKSFTYLRHRPSSLFCCIYFPWSNVLSTHSSFTLVYLPGVPQATRLFSISNSGVKAGKFKE